MPSETDIGNAALGGAESPQPDILDEPSSAEQMQQAEREAYVEDANRVARGGMAYESSWSGDAVRSLREDLQAQLEFTEAHPEVVDALMTAAKADAFDAITEELGLFTRDKSREPERGKVPILGARDVAEAARNQTHKNNADVWHTLENGTSIYNRSLIFALQELVTGDAQRPYKTERTGPDRNDYEIVGRYYDGPHVRTVIEGFLKNNDTTSDQAGQEPK